MRGIVLALTLAALVAAAPAAAADDVWLWACHGPDGRPLGALGDHVSPPEATCAGEAGLLAGAGSSWRFDMPVNTALNAVRIRRAGSLGDGGTYRLDAAGPLESVTGETVDAADRTFPAGGSRVSLAVTCDGECEGVEASALAFRVRDAQPPSGSVGGWRSPADHTLTLQIQARDLGLGLKSATAYLDGTPVDTDTFGDRACADLSPGSSQIDLPFGLVGQNDRKDPSGHFTPFGCVGIGTATLEVDTTKVADGKQHTIAVTVSDFANNTATLMSNSTEIVNTPRQYTSVQYLTIGNSGVVQLPGPGGGDPGGGGVKGASASSCVSPQLSMRLTDKPLRISKGVPVLLARKAYRFKGRLTCLIGGRRHSAPKRVRVDILVQKGRKTVGRSRTATRARGRINVRLKFKKSRNVVFRVTAPNGRRDQVRIKLRVQKLRRLRAAVHARWFRFVLPRDQVRFATLEARRVPKRATIKVRCSGPGCPGGFRRTAKPKHYRKKLSLIAGLAGANLLPGASVYVTISKRGYRGIGKLYCIRDGQRVKARGYRLGGKRPRC